MHERDALDVRLARPCRRRLRRHARSTTASARRRRRACCCRRRSKFAACYLGALRVGAITSAINLRLGADRAGEHRRPQRAGRHRAWATASSSPTARPPARDPRRGDLQGRLRGRRRRADLPRLDPDRPDLHRVDERHDRRARRAPCTTTSARPRSHATSASSPEPGDRRLVVLPFAARRLHDPHVGRARATARRSCSLASRGRPTETLRLIRDEGITMATGVPTQWAARARPSRPRDAPTSRGCGSPASARAAIPPDLVRRMREMLGCPVITPLHEHRGRRHHEHARRATRDEVIATTVGRPTPDVELRIVDAGRRPSSVPTARWARSCAARPR